MEERPTVLIIPGSLRRQSYSCSLGEAICDALDARRVGCRLWDFRIDPLPHADPKYHHNPEDHPNEAVRRFVRSADEADAFVLITPIYHNGVSGVLKSALDILTIPQLLMKPVGLASHGGGRTTQAVEQLRIIVRGLRGLAITTQVCTARSDYGQPSNEGLYPVQSSAIKLRIERFCDELVVMAGLMPVARRVLGVETNHSAKQN